LKKEFAMSNAKKQRVENEKEIARLAAILKQLPAALVAVLTVGQLRRAFNLKVHAQTVRRIRNGFERSNGEGKTSDPATGSEEQPPLWLEQQVVLQKIGHILCKSYAHLGDAEIIGTEDALLMIYRELKQFDYSLITRFEGRKRLPRQRRTLTSQL
jgi:hypothetical protein